MGGRRWLDLQAGLFADLSAQAIDDRLVEFEHAAWWFPVAVVAALLQLDEGDQVLVRRRLYLADDWPMETATSYIPWDLADGTAMVEHNPGPGGIYARLEDAGHPLERFREDVTARMPSPDEARMLGCRRVCRCSR